MKRRQRDSAQIEAAAIGLRLRDKAPCGPADGRSKSCWSSEERNFR